MGENATSRLERELGDGVGGGMVSISTVINGGEPLRVTPSDSLKRHYRLLIEFIGWI